MPWVAKWNNKRLSELQKMLNDKIPYDKIAEHYGIKRVTLQKVISGFNLKGSRARVIDWTPEKIKETKELLQKGMSCNILAEMYGITTWALYKAIDRYNMRVGKYKKN